MPCASPRLCVSALSSCSPPPGGPYRHAPDPWIFAEAFPRSPECAAQHCRSSSSRQRAKTRRLRRAKRWAGRGSRSASRLRTTRTASGCSRAAITPNSRYSNLAQITPANAKDLHVAWTFSTGVLRGHEGQPLVVDNTMYIVTPYPNVAYALDLTQPGYPLKWKYRPENAQAAVGVACCDVVNRGAAYADGKIFYNLLDGHTVAVDAATGTELWRMKMGDLESRRDDDDGADRREGQSHRRLERRRDGRARLDRRARPRDGQGDLARVQHRPRRRHQGRARDSSPSMRKIASRTSGTTSWPGDSWKSRRRDRVGVDVVRPRAQSHLPRHVESRAVERRISARATTSGAPRSSRATPTPARWSGRSSRRRTTSGTTTR